MIKKEEIRKEANYILNKDITLRELSQLVKRSKSAISNDLKKLKNIDFIQYQKIKKVLKKHQENKHIEGGNKMKEKYFKNK